jgi:hypothetical protein
VPDARPPTLCPCTSFVPSEADALRDKRWRQDMALCALDGAEATIEEAYGKDVVEKCVPLLRRIREIMKRATIPGE